MLIEFYGLNEDPFGMTPNPRFLYLSSMHREAAASLVYGIEAERGFLALMAEPGMGKTTLLYQLLERLRPAARTAFVFQTQCDAASLLRQLARELGLNPSISDPVDISENLKELLLCEAECNRRVVLIVDEAQNLEQPALEALRLLSNFETAGTKLLHIVLSGQPGLGHKLSDSSLLQLRQRISIILRLAPFSYKDVEAYISHRLRVAGLKGNSFFTPEACACIAEMSHGVPRNINNICFNALSLGYAVGKPRITADIVTQVGRDLDCLAPHKAALLCNGRPAAPASTQVAPRRECGPSHTDEGKAVISPVERKNRTESGTTAPLSGEQPADSVSHAQDKRRRIRGARAGAVCAILAVLGSGAAVSVYRSLAEDRQKLSAPRPSSGDRTLDDATARSGLRSQAARVVHAGAEEAALPVPPTMESKPSNDTSSVSTNKDGSNIARSLSNLQKAGDSSAHPRKYAIPPVVDTSNLSEIKNDLTGAFAAPGIEAQWPDHAR